MSQIITHSVIANALIAINATNIFTISIIDDIVNMTDNIAIYALTTKIIECTKIMSDDAISDVVIPDSTILNDSIIDDAIMDAAIEKFPIIIMDVPNERNHYIMNAIIATERYAIACINAAINNTDITKNKTISEAQLWTRISKFKTCASTIEAVLDDDVVCSVIGAGTGNRTNICKIKDINDDKIANAITNTISRIIEITAAVINKIHDVTDNKYLI